MIIKITSKRHLQEVLKDNPTVVVDYWANWCGPCKVAKKFLQESHQNYPDVVFAMVNIDEQREIATESNVSKLPTFVLYKSQEPVIKREGGLDKSVLDQLINS